LSGGGGGGCGGADGRARAPRQVEAMLRGEGEGGITFEAIHGQDTAVIRAADLDIDRFLPARAETPRSRPAPAADLPAAPTRVLLTGANGFLGRFLLLDLLQRVSEQCAPRPRARGRPSRAPLCVARCCDAAAMQRGRSAGAWAAGLGALGLAGGQHVCTDGDGYGGVARWPHCSSKRSPTRAMEAGPRASAWRRPQPAALAVRRRRRNTAAAPAGWRRAAVR